MSKPLSKLTAQGQVSVPAQVRKRLGVGPGSVLEWEIEGDEVIVRRAGRFTSEDIHKVLFPNGVEPKTLKQLKAGIEDYIRKKHARR